MNLVKKQQRNPICGYIQASKRVHINPTVCVCKTDADIIRRYSSTVFMELLYQMHIPDTTISKAVSMHTAGHMQEESSESLPNDLENAENTLPIIAMNKIKKLFAIEKEIEALSLIKRSK